MHTRDEVRPVAAGAADAGDAAKGRLIDGLGRTTMMALTALSGCLLLIALGAAISLCWTIHPLLSAIAGLGMLWCAGRVAGRILSPGSRAR